MKTYRQFISEEAEITHQQLVQFERMVDHLFKRFGIDFEFSKHFEERLSHGRNNPAITLKDLAELIKKIYAKQGNPLKNKPGTEVVIKDVQSNINIPIAIKYDSKNDEIDVVAKTVMRKSDFKSPDPIVRY